jgi:hypothetical protein
MSGKPARLPFFLAASLAAWAVLIPAPALSAQKDWPPIPAEDAAMTDCPQQPGAAAVYLFREEISNDQKREIKVHKRLKILTAAGRDWANVEITYAKGVNKVVDIEARVVDEDGQSRVFGGQVYDKTILRGPGIRVAVKTFALPDVKPGSIIDYRYRLVPDHSEPKGKVEDILDALEINPGKPPEGDIGKGMKLLSFPVEIWDIQEDLFVRKPDSSTCRGSSSARSCPSSLTGHATLTWFTKNVPEARPVWNKGQFELEIENIPPFEAEELMPPESSEKMGVYIFYFDSDFKEPEAYWETECRSWQKAADGFIGKTRKLVELSRETIGGETDPQKALYKLYERAQQVRNLSYEKSLTSKQRKAQKIKDNRSAADVLERGYGYRSDITRAFVALARAAGYEGQVVRVSTRDDKLFFKKFMSFALQLDSEVAMVTLGDKTLFLDPATPFCPFGLVHWSRSGSAAVRPSDSPPEFFSTRLSLPDLALTQREIALRLDGEGNAAGTVKVTYVGHEALVRRLDHLHDDREEIRESFEEELSGRLPLGAKVTMSKLDNIDNSYPALVVEYDVAIPGLATAAGDRMLLPASPLLGSRQHPFRHAERKFPVYFPYPFREFNDIVISLPEGTVVETCPASKKTPGEFSSYSLVCVQEEPLKLHVQRDLVIHREFFPVDRYPSLKAFYDLVRSGDTDPFVLRPPALAVITY